MKYLVTGSAGFIGSTLSEHLRDIGQEVIEIDPANASGAILNLKDLETKAQGCAGIFHLGAVASVPKSIEDPEGSYAVNVTGTKNVFKAAKHAGNIPVVYASSTAVYGDNENLPLSETETPHPLSPYAKHKHQNEIDAKTYGREFDLPTFGARLFNIYGHGENQSSPYAGVISLFYKNLFRDEDITIFGDGLQTRDFVAIDDAVKGLLLCMQHADPQAPVANICTGHRVSLIELAETLGTVMGKHPQLIFKNSRIADIKHSLGDPTLMQNLTGFKSSISLKDGLQKLVKAGM